MRKGWNLQGGRGVMASFLEGSIWMVAKRKPTPPEGRRKDVARKCN